MTAPAEHEQPLRHPLMQGIGYELSLPDPNPEVAGAAIAKARWGFCYDVANPRLRVVVTAILAPVPPPPPPPGAPAPPPPASAAMVDLEAIASDEDLDAIIAWLGSFKAAMMTARTRQQKKEQQKDVEKRLLRT